MDLIPVRLVQYEIAENERIKLIVPRFKNRVLINIFTGKRISKNFRITLDAIGSKIWIAIDGIESVEEISKKFNYSGEKKDDFDQQLTAFITKLYREGFITFNQLLVSKS